MTLSCIWRFPLKKYLLALVIPFLLLFSACAERKQSNNSNLLGAVAIFNGCSPTTVNSIGGTSRTEYNLANCLTPLGLTGFTVTNISAGFTGTSVESKMASNGTFGSIDKKTNIEVTYTLNSATSFLDVIALGSGTGSSVSGPGFRISQTDVKYIKTNGTTGTFGTGTSPVSIVGTSTTLCLEVHEEGAGSHIFGWTGACSAVSNRGAYGFEEEDVAGAISDRKIGFTLNNVTLSKIIVSNGALGTAGSLQSF